MYSDDKTWKQHYTEWCKIVDKMRFLDFDNTTPAQYDYRKHVFQRLIKDYESSHA